VDILHNRPMRLAARPPEQIAADLAAISHPKMPNLTMRLKTVPSASIEKSYSKKRFMIIAAAIAAVAVIAMLFWALV
jgi:hypothetical protein